MFYVDDVKSSHRDEKVVDNFKQWIDVMYGFPNIGKVKSVRQKVYEYLSITLDYTTNGEVKSDRQKYVKT